MAGKGQHTIGVRAIRGALIMFLDGRQRCVDKRLKYLSADSAFDFKVAYDIEQKKSRSDPAN